MSRSAAMKSLYPLLCALLLVCHAQAAGLKIPATVFRLAQLEEAVKQAKEKKKPLAVIAADASTTAKAMVDVSDDTLKSLLDYAVVVFIDGSEGKVNGLQLLSPPFFTAFQDNAKPVLPRVIIGTPTEDEVWLTVNGDELQGGKHKKMLRETAATIKAKATPYFASKTPHAPVMPGDKMLMWGKADKSGQYKAKFVKLDGENIQVSDEAGKEGSIKVSELSPAAVRYVKFIGGEAAPVPDAAAPPAAGEKPAAAGGGVEAWTNKQGKEIQASFVKLAAGKVTLKDAAGKEYTLPLDSLSPASQARAKELGAPAKKP